tara:strand:- start:12772 stop:13113 length:342 start_codon:yes stop_codon:yes gene_type:complete
MDNKKMLILGGGALGFAALGYLGLKFMNDDDENEEPELVFSKKEQLNKKIKIEKDKVEEEVKEEIENQKQVVPKDKELYNSIENEDNISGWGQFWKTTYNKQIKDEVDASDYN